MVVELINAGLATATPERIVGVGYRTRELRADHGGGTAGQRSVSTVALVNGTPPYSFSIKRYLKKPCRRAEDDDRSSFLRNQVTPCLSQLARRLQQP
jgi:hypothetical protein